MKKIIFILAMSLFVFVNANAQNVWEIDYHQADELKGTEDYYSNFYADTNGNYFVCWSNTTKIKIGTDVGIFDYDTKYGTTEYGSYSSYQYTTVIIGFYVSGALTEKATTKFYVPDGDEDTAYTSNITIKGLDAKIINHIKTKGDVRIIASRYGRTDFDITIPMNNTLK